MLGYFDERCKVFLIALNEAQSYFAVEGIHNLRLEIKRFRVLHALVDYTAPSFAPKSNISNFKELFQAAGALRNLDINQAITLQWLKTLDLSEYFNDLKYKEMQLRVAFSDIASKFPPDTIAQSRRLVYSALAIVSEENQRKRMRKRLLKFAAGVNGLMNKNKPGNDDLHTIRKMAKSLRYTLDMWQACFGKTALTADVSNQLKKAYRDLGDWHDFLLAHESVNAFLRGKARNLIADSATYRKFQKELQQRTGSFLVSYERNKETLFKSLTRLTTELH